MRAFDRRAFLAAAAACLTPAAVAQAGQNDWHVPDALQRDMYDAALGIARSKVKGGAHEPYFKKPFADAAFNNNIYLWDTCFIAAYAKYHQDVLPIGQALDNFYGLQDGDGWICREYMQDGRPFWPKHHPVAINPPLLAFAELELYSRSGDVGRLTRVYPHLKAFFGYLVEHYRMPDGLFFFDTLGSGMDNIPRHPDGWTDDGKGIGDANLYPDVFTYGGLDPLWNRQGRMVDFSAQMALCANQMATIAATIGQGDDVAAYRTFHDEVAQAVNDLCWHEGDGFYYDLGYGRQIRRKHIGMFWVMWAGIVPAQRLPRLLGHLTDPKQFWRRIPVATYPADQAAFDPAGGYWLGSVWAPTNYMIIRGLTVCGQHELSDRLARQYYWSVAEVFKQTGTFWENYAPDSLARGNQSARDFCGWTAVVPIALWHEVINRAPVRA